MARRYASYSNKELAEALAAVNNDLGLAGYCYMDCEDRRRAYWRNRLRTLGHKKRLVCGELARRKLLYDPKGRYNRSTGRKSDARETQ